MLWFFESFFPVVWIAFLIYWRIKAAGTKTTQRSEPALLPVWHLALLDWSRCYRRGPSRRRLGAPAPRQQLEQRRND
jgi:hypothetical protein